MGPSCNRTCKTFVAHLNMKQNQLISICRRITFILADLSLSLSLCGLLCPFQPQCPSASKRDTFRSSLFSHRKKKWMDGCMEPHWAEGIRAWGWVGWLRWDGGDGSKRGCLSNHIAEPVPERYRFTLATIPALLVKAQPRWGMSERARRGMGGGVGGATYL